MKYRALNHFLAFGKAPERGEYVDLTEEQAAVLDREGLIAPYEIKVQPVPENKSGKKKQSESAPAVPVLTKPTARRYGRTATK